jgi:hypothetical protein
MKENPHWGAVTVMTAAVIIMLSSNSQGQTAVPSPVAGQTNDQSSGATPSSSPANGGQLEQVTVTGYLIPRVGEGPQPVATRPTRTQAGGSRVLAVLDAIGPLKSKSETSRTIGDKSESEYHFRS